MSLRNWIGGIIMTFMVVMLTSCESQVDFDQIVQVDEPIQLITLVKNDRSMLGDKTEIVLFPNSEKHQHFLKWLSENKTGWKKTIASYEPRSVIQQNDFQLNYMGYFVAVKYKDASGKSHHYSKTTNVEALSFLFD